MIAPRAKLSRNSDHDLGKLGLDLRIGHEVGLDMTLRDHHIVNIPDKLVLMQAKKLSQQSLDPIPFHCLPDFFAHRRSQSKSLVILLSGADIDQKVCTEVSLAMPVAQKIIAA